MDENTKVKLEERMKELLALAKKKKNMLEYQEVVDFFVGFPIEEEQLDKIVEALEADEYFHRAWRTEVGSSLTAVSFYRKMGY